MQFESVTMYNQDFLFCTAKKYILSFSNVVSRARLRLMFAKMTHFMRHLAHHPHATPWLFFYSVIESVFFPVPPDVILAPLALVHPHKALFFALIAALGSATGGLVGYFIGFYAFEPLARPVLSWLCQYSSSACPDYFVPWIKTLFEQHGFWVVAVSSLSPLIPYRLTILAAGLGHMALLPFIVISFAMHFLRYGLLSYMVARYGKASYAFARKKLPLIFTGIGVVILVAYVITRYF